MVIAMSGEARRQAKEIDRSSPVPLYHQLEQILRDDIERGVYEPRSLLPSESEICDLYGVSRSVVRQTLTNLAQAGLVRSQRGRGTFVAEPKLHERFVQRATGFYEDLTRMGLSIETRVVRQEMVELPYEVREFLRAERGVRIDRVRSVDGRLLAFVTTYLPEGRYSGIEHHDLTDKSLYAHLAERYGSVVDGGRRTVGAVSAEGEVARHLQVEEGAPLLLLRSASYADDGEPLEWFDAWHRADRALFEIDIVPGEPGRFVSGVVVESKEDRSEIRPAGNPWESTTADAIRSAGVIAVLRGPRYSDPAVLTAGLVEGGIRVIEFTLTAENALEAIAEAQKVEDAIVGAGSVLDAVSARDAISAGARFLVSPVAAVQVLEVANEVPVVLAGHSPTEVWAAHRTTEGPVKLFPAFVGGPEYVRSLLAPMPELELIPSGGVDPSNAAAYLEAGAVAVYAGSSLCPPEALLAGDGEELARRARAFRAALDRDPG
jgi:GntR family transcriptional regulator